MVTITNANGETRKIRKKLFVTIDCETAGSLQEPIVYDIGFAVHDKYGEIYAKYSFMIKEVYIDRRKDITNAYYSSKFPQYDEEIRQGKRKVVTWELFKKIINAVIEKYQVSAKISFNCSFDERAVDFTERFLNNFENGNIFDKEVPWWDSLRMAKESICCMRKYKKFCQENNYMTKRNVPKGNAETVYRFITGDLTFIEKHTGLEDVLIEIEITTAVFKKGKKVGTHPYIRG